MFSFLFLLSLALLLCLLLFWLFSLTGFSEQHRARNVWAQIFLFTSFNEESLIKSPCTSRKSAWQWISIREWVPSKTTKYRQELRRGKRKRTIHKSEHIPSRPISKNMYRLQKKESSELKRRLACFEGSNPSTSRSYASDDDLNTQSLELSVSMDCRGSAKSHKWRIRSCWKLTAAFSRNHWSWLRKIKSALQLSSCMQGSSWNDPRRNCKSMRPWLRLSSHHLNKFVPRFCTVQTQSLVVLQLFRAVSTEHMPPSPTGSISTTETGVSDGNMSPRKSSDEKPPRHPQNQVPLTGYAHLVTRGDSWTNAGLVV